MRKSAVALAIAAVLSAPRRRVGTARSRANYDIFKDVSSQVNRYVNFTVFDNVARVDRRTAR